MRRTSLRLPLLLLTTLLLVALTDAIPTLTGMTELLRPHTVHAASCSELYCNCHEGCWRQATTSCKILHGVTLVNLTGGCVPNDDPHSADDRSQLRPRCTRDGLDIDHRIPACDPYCNHRKC